MSTKLSKSAERFSFQRNAFLKRCKESVEYFSDSYIVERLEIMDNESKIRAELEERSGWSKNNMEYDLRTTDWILEKARSKESYAQNLYAALCNNEFKKINITDTPENVVAVLNDQFPLWSCSWRYAGGIIADMQEQGDYIDWYCSGIRNCDYEDKTDLRSTYFVSEGVVTDEIRADLLKLGWRVEPDDDSLI